LIAESDLLLEVRNLSKLFPLPRSIMAWLTRKETSYIRAVDGVSFYVSRGEIFGIAGESGSGKTTLARLILRLIEPTAGKIIFEGCDITLLSQRELKEVRRRIQPVFQDPYGSLNPRQTVYDIITEPLLIHRICRNEGEKVRRACEALEFVRLSSDFLVKFPHQLSGGERQRVAIARAIILEPSLIVADEPVSMLDASVRSGILKLMLDLRGRLNLAYVFITHDLAVAKNICDRMAIMYLGKILEMGRCEDVIGKSLHPYTQMLVSSVPVPDPSRRTEYLEVKVEGEVPSAAKIPSGCRFWPRCPYAEDKCHILEPQLIDVGGGHQVACHLAG